ncbi:PREDICTED: RNA-binding protein 4B-like, partial [Acanthisitta chloris]|uniref:RNA-binding protein 4B-like n=1 Tax=Acanthisitta chloris TaxID=57068 RepID=UPI0004F0E6C9
IGNLPREATEQEIRSLFEQYGKVLECDIIKNYGFVHIEDRTAAEDAIRNLHHHKLHGVCINVEASKTKGKASTKLHVGNISPTCTNLELRAKFEEYGPVIECDIVKDYAFVHMERAEDAVEAIRGLDNTEFQGEGQDWGDRMDRRTGEVIHGLDNTEFQGEGQDWGDRMDRRTGEVIYGLDNTELQGEGQEG